MHVCMHRWVPTYVHAYEHDVCVCMFMYGDQRRLKQPSSAVLVLFLSQALAMNLDLPVRVLISFSD